MLFSVHIVIYSRARVAWRVYWPVRYLVEVREVTLFLPNTHLPRLLVGRLEVVNVYPEVVALRGLVLALEEVQLEVAEAQLGAPTYPRLAAQASVRVNLAARMRPPFRFASLPSSDPGAEHHLERHLCLPKGSQTVARNA